MAAKTPANLVQVTSTTTGTGNLTVAAMNGKVTFNTAFGTGSSNLFNYFVTSRDVAEWEIGTGHLSNSTTLVRDTVVLSSNANAAVNFSAGTKDVTNDIPASEQDVTGLVEDTSPDIAADFVLAYDTSATARKKDKPINFAAGFCANKNGTNQTGVATITYTKLTFTTEVFDTGSYYDSTNSKWTPPACKAVSVTIQVYASSGVNSFVGAILYKNGAAFARNFTYHLGDSAANITIVDVPNGTDYYEAYVLLDTGTTGTIAGATTDSFFCGKIL